MTTPLPPHRLTPTVPSKQRYISSQLFRARARPRSPVTSPILNAQVTRPALAATFANRNNILSNPDGSHQCYSRSAAHQSTPASAVKLHHRVKKQTTPYNGREGTLLTRHFSLIHLRTFHMQKSQSFHERTLISAPHARRSANAMPRKTVPSRCNAQWRVFAAFLGAII